MEHTWTVDGWYAHWTMTLTATDLDEADLRRFLPSRALERLAEQFNDTVNLYECLRDREVCACHRHRLRA